MSRCEATLGVNRCRHEAVKKIMFFGNWLDVCSFHDIAVERVEEVYGEDPDPRGK